MKQSFIEKRFNGGAKKLIGQMSDILANYAGQGYDLSLRQLYYQLVSKNIVPNTEQSYKRVGSILSEARLAGLVDWNMIVDRGRYTSENSHWNSPASIIGACAAQFKYEKWASQPWHIEVMVEKCNKGILYQMGAGGHDPSAPRPSDYDGRCDCSGFALAWVAGIDRQQDTWSEDNDKVLQFRKHEQIGPDCWDCLRCWPGADSRIHGMMIARRLWASDMHDTPLKAIESAIVKELDRHETMMNALNESLEQAKLDHITPCAEVKK